MGWTFLYCPYICFVLELPLKRQVTFSKGMPDTSQDYQSFLCCSQKLLIWRPSDSASLHRLPFALQSKKKDTHIWLTHCWGQLDSNELLNLLHCEAPSVFSSKHFQYSSRAPQQTSLSFIDGAAIPRGLKLLDKITFYVNKELAIWVKARKKYRHSLHPIFKLHLWILMIQLKLISSKLTIPGTPAFWSFSPYPS